MHFIKTGFAIGQVNKSHLKHTTASNESRKPITHKEIKVKELVHIREKTPNDDNVASASQHASRGSTKENSKEL